jgi:hypothetical protein
MKQFLHLVYTRHLSIDLGLAATAITVASVALVMCAQLP